MKKALLIILFALALCGCAKDETAPTLGQYIYESGNLTVSVSIYEPAGASITIFVDGRYVYQDLYGSRTGTWPTYALSYSFFAVATYASRGEVVLDCEFQSSTSFTATVSENTTDVELPTTMQFTQDSRVLDYNGDGVLDSWESYLFND